MKKIEFGFNNDDTLNATWEGIARYNGEYLDTIRCNDMNFLIVRVVDSLDGLNGQIEVREVAQDYYNDGNYLTFANSEKSDLCVKLENYLNNKKVREKLLNKRALSLLREANFPAFSSRLPKIEGNSEEFAEVITLIKPEMFKKLKESKRSGLGVSMYHLVAQNRASRQEIERLNKEIERLTSEIETLKLSSNAKKH